MKGKGIKYFKLISERCLLNMRISQSLEKKHRVWKMSISIQNCPLFKKKNQVLFLIIQLSFPVSIMSQWWVKRSSGAVVILASPKTFDHSPKLRFVVTINDVLLYNVLTRWNSKASPAWEKSSYPNSSSTTKSIFASLLANDPVLPESFSCSSLLTRSMTLKNLPLFPKRMHRVAIAEARCVLPVPVPPMKMISLVLRKNCRYKGL